MIYISKKNELSRKSVSDSKEDKKESQYLLRVIYDTEDENVRKLLEGIFGPDQMLDVKNGKIAKINSTLSPKQRDYFLGMVSDALNKMDEEDNSTDESIEEISIEKDYDLDQNYIEEEDTYDIDSEEQSTKEDSDNTEKIKKSRKVSAEKLIQEFANFLNNIS